MQRPTPNPLPGWTGGTLQVSQSTQAPQGQESCSQPLTSRGLREELCQENHQLALRSQAGYAQASLLPPGQKKCRHGFPVASVRGGGEGRILPWAFQLFFPLSQRFTPAPHPRQPCIFRGVDLAGRTLLLLVVSGQPLECQAEAATRRQQGTQAGRAQAGATLSPSLPKPASQSPHPHGLPTEPSGRPAPSGGVCCAPPPPGSTRSDVRWGLWRPGRPLRPHLRSSAAAVLGADGGESGAGWGQGRVCWRGTAGWSWALCPLPPSAVLLEVSWRGRGAQKAPRKMHLQKQQTRTPCRGGRRGRDWTIFTFVSTVARTPPPPAEDRHTSPDPGVTECCAWHPAWRDVFFHQAVSCPVAQSPGLADGTRPVSEPRRSDAG